eukprot:m.111591 g.111591  ORF g.111591 m.111591 type:complete len:193 (+) comp9238_c2_seq1:607-1185(+)
MGIFISDPILCGGKRNVDVRTIVPFANTVGVGTQREQQFHKNRVMDELDHMRQDPNVSDIAILDPTFNSNKTHVIAILNSLPSSLHKVSLQIRPERLSRVFLEAADDSTAKRVILEMGVPTLNPLELFHINRVKGGDPTKVVEKVKEKLLLAEEYPGLCKEITLIYMDCHIKPMIPFMRPMIGAERTQRPRL